MNLPDITSAAFKANPFPTYSRLRSDSPVHRLQHRQGPVWLVTRYRDVEQVLKDVRLSKNQDTAPRYAPPLPWQPRFVRALNQQMLMQDPPNHTRLRALVSKAFTPKLVEGLRARIQKVTDERLDAVAQSGQMDLVRDFALPIPLTVIADMLGIPLEDREKFTKWTRPIVGATAGFDFLLALPSIWAFDRYLRSLIARRRGSQEEDMVAALLRAEEAGSQLSEDELVAMVFLLLIAGHETTVNLIATGALGLIEHPEQWDRLRAQPDLIKPAVEELLRYTSPVDVATARYSATECEVAGTTIPKGELVLAIIGSANRDETVFQQPEGLDLGREPNRHLAFGHGAHYCLGAPLARLEAQIAFTALARRASRLQLAVPRERLRWRSGLLIRGLESLPVRL